MTLDDKVKQAGVGGVGFPTHVKMASKAVTVIANGAECEPLLHKDAVVVGRQIISEAGVLVNAVVISRPHPDVYREVI